MSTTAAAAVQAAAEQIANSMRGAEMMQQCCEDKCQIAGLAWRGLAVTHAAMTNAAAACTTVILHN